MRTLILSMSVTLDGFVSGADGDTQWIFSGDQDAMAWKLHVLQAAGLIVMGSRAFQNMAPFWIKADNMFAATMNQVPKVVFSQQGSRVKDGVAKSIAETDNDKLHGAESWAQAHVAGGDLAVEIARMKAQDGKPIVALGGASFARSLIAADLVDDYALMVHPVALGKGLPIFSEIPSPRRFDLLRSNVFPRGLMAQRLRPASSAANADHKGWRS